MTAHRESAVDRVRAAVAGARTGPAARPRGGRHARTLLYAGVVLLLAGCVPIGVRVQNMLALWTG